MYVVIWEYQVKPDRLGEFEEIYSEEGAWVQLFRKSPGFRGTELLADTQHAGRYITIDRWASARDYEEFLSASRDEYAELDVRFEELTESEISIGKWDAIK